MVTPVPPLSLIQQANKDPNVQEAGLLGLDKLLGRELSDSIERKLSGGVLG